MKSIAQDARFRLSAIKHAEKKGVSMTALKYGVSRQSIYRWRKRYDGTLESLMNKSRRPYSHPRQHTPEELKLILDMRRRNPKEGLELSTFSFVQFFLNTRNYFPFTIK